LREVRGGLLRRYSAGLWTYGREPVIERRNGNFLLQISGHPTYGLPFGQDRIVPIYLATLAVRQQGQTIRFRTAAEILESFGMHKRREEYRRLVSALKRIFGQRFSSAQTH
jgi:plasmid replication initiation protein